MHPSVLAFDVLAVFVFVIVGRANHGESAALISILHTAAPFLLALVAAWSIARAWSRPSDLRTGVVVAAITIACGILLRRTVFGDGIALTFIVVATLVLSALIIGWRAGPALMRQSHSQAG